MANLAAANLWQRKTRSAISVVGIGIGIALLLVLKGMLLGTISEITSRMENTGADVLVFGGGNFSAFANTIFMPMSYKTAIEKNAGDKIESIVPILQEQITPVGTVTQPNRVWGVANKDLAAINVVINNGRAFNDDKREMLIDSRLSQHSGKKIGDTVRFLGVNWDVVGITDVGTGVRVYVPYKIMLAMTSGDWEGANIFAIKVKKDVNVEQLAQSMRTIEIPDPQHQGQTLPMQATFIPVGSMYETFRDSAGIINDFANAVTFVALIISFLIILLTMYTIVAERTRDIGILKSLGASRMLIARNIITESLVLCVLGVIAGVGISLLAAHVIPIISLLDVTISKEWIGIAAVIGLVGGLLGAMVPATIAANKDPVVAITYE